MGFGTHGIRETQLRTGDNSSILKVVSNSRFTCTTAEEKTIILSALPLSAIIGKLCKAQSQPISLLILNQQHSDCNISFKEKK